MQPKRAEIQPKSKDTHEMLMHRLLLAAALLLPAVAWADPTTAISPPPLTGYGTLAVVVTSIPISGATPGPNSPAFPGGNLPNNQITIKNAIGSANPLFVCPLGGTCTVLVGIPLAPGESQTWYIKALNGSLVSPTVITAGTATAVVSF